MHTYTKRYIDNLVHKAIFCKCTVSIKNLSKEDIEKIKLNLTKNKDKKNKSDEPAKKKPKLDTSGVDILKMVLSREGESDKFKSKFKSALKPSIEIPPNSTQDIPMEVDGTKSNETATDSTNQLIGKIWCRSYSVLVDKTKVNNYAVNFLSQSIYDTKKPVLSVKPSSSAHRQIIGNGVKPSSSTPRQIIGNGVKPSSSAPRQIIGNGIKPSSSAPRQTVNGTKASSNRPRQTVYGVNKLTSNEIRPTINGVKHHVNGRNLSMRGNLNETEQLYTKYFSKFVQDTIVTIANILNIISMSNKHHKARMDESFRKKTEAEKLKERCDANRTHDKHKRILEAKLQKYFSIAVSTFEDSEFDSTFRMFFLSILTVLRVLDQPKFKKGSIFKNLVLLLWNSLKNSLYDNDKVYDMFRSKKFRPDCIDLIGLIEDSRDNDPGITDRMTLFFVSTVNSREYFQAVIDAVTRDSNEDLGILIDNASMQCSINSKFKNPVVAVRNSAEIIPVTPNETIQQWVIQNKPAGSIHIPVQNGYKTQTNGNTATEQSFVTNFYESFSNSLYKKVSSESSTSKGIQPRKCVVITPSTSNNSLVHQVTSLETATATTTAGTLVTFKPSGLNKIPMPSKSLNTIDNTIYVGNKQYQLVKGSSSQIRALVNGNNILVKSPPAVNINCYANNCNRVATIMCSSCTTVKYCSHNCQRIDWYACHIHNCTRLLNMKQTQK